MNCWGSSGYPGTTMGTPLFSELIPAGCLASLSMLPSQVSMPQWVYVTFLLNSSVSLFFSFFIFLVGIGLCVCEKELY